MKNALRFLVSIILILNLRTHKTFAQTLSCKLNIDATGKYFQIGNAGGTNARWVMKGVHTCIAHITGDGNGGWEGASNMINNWNNRDAQLTGMRNYGINCVRIWMPGPIGRDVPNPSYTGTTMDQHYNELVTYISLCKQKGLWVIMEDWWAGYLKEGNTDAYYNSGEWHDKMLIFINRLAAAGCDNVMFGTGNEEIQLQYQFGIGWAGNYKDNTIKMIAGYRRLGYTGPILVDTEGFDNQPGSVGYFAEIRNSDPSRNIGFQEHEYFNYNAAANGYYYLPVCRTGYNGGMAMENFPMFVTEFAFTSSAIDDAVANFARNNNLGGWSYFWYNNIYTAATTNGDGINLTGEAIDIKDRFWLAAGIPGGYYPTGPNVSVTGVIVSPATSSVVSGSSIALTAAVSPANATNGTLNWSSSNTGVATVNSSGAVTGVAAGTATITATSTDGSNKSASSTITVTINTNPNLALNKPATASTSDGGLTASLAFDGNGSTRWSSLFSDPQWIQVDLGASYAITSVKLNWEGAYGKSYQVQVSGDGSSWTNIYSTTTGGGGTNNLTGLSGTGRYVRMYGTQRGTGFGYSLYEFEVYGTAGSTSTPVTGVTVSPASATIAAGSSSQLGATVAPGNATNQNVSWSSSNSSVATVNASGLVSGVTAGSATITVTTQDGNKTATAAITVTGGAGGGAAIPGKIEAESYSGMSGIQTESTADAGGGLDVGYTDNGDYMNYSVTVATAGTYTADLRVASAITGSQIQLKSGSTVLSTVNVPNTGGWQSWQTISSGSFSLAAGAQTLQVYVSTGGWNLNWMQFKTGTGTGTGPVTDIFDQPGTLTAQGDNQPGEGREKATDNSTATKWLDFANGNPSTRSSWLQYQLTSGTFVVTQYTVTSANDAPDRDPRSWTLQGSNNNVNWTVLDTKTNEVFASRFQKNTYSISNTTGYSYYKLQINGVNNPSVALAMQVAEIEMLGSTGGAAPAGNLALNKPATASTSDGGLSASLAFDGNGSSRWSSSFTDPSWISVDLGASYTISRVKLSWEAAYGKTYRIQVSGDGVNWTDMYSTTTGAGGVNDVTGLSGTGRYVRMYGTERGTPWGYSLYEFEVYGIASGLRTAGTPALALVAGARPLVTKEQLKVYPNPASQGSVNIRIEGQQDNTSISIYTVTGVTEYAGTLYKGETKRISRLSPGMHLIRISGKTINEIRRIVVTK
jgi:uncharacterized protein YjdB